MLIPVLSAAALVTAVFAIWGEYKPTRTQLYLSKPLTTILIILIPLLGVSSTAPTYKWLIIVGLIFCLGGDIFLMLPAKYFIVGLVSFLIGHIFYIIAFVADAGFNLGLGWLIPLIVYGLIMYRLLAPGLGKLKGPVIVYILAILVMAWQAWGRWSVLTGTGTLLAAVGAMVFVISDSILAYDRFRQKFKISRIVVLSTYWAAQWLIAYSVIVN